MKSMSVTFDTSHFETSQLKDGRKENMPSMLVTLDTSHLEISPLNEIMEQNMSAALTINKDPVNFFVAYEDDPKCKHALSARDYSTSENAQKILAVLFNNTLTFFRVF